MAHFTRKARFASASAKVKPLFVTTIAVLRKTIKYECKNKTQAKPANQDAGICSIIRHPFTGDEYSDIAMGDNNDSYCAVACSKLSGIPGT